MAPDPLKARARGTGPLLAFHIIGVKGYYNSVQPPPPPLSEIPGSAPDYLHLLLREENNAIGFKLFRYFIFNQLKYYSTSCKTLIHRIERVLQENLR